MVKVSWKILLIIIPIAFVFGLFTLAFGQSDTPDFPSFNVLLARFSTAPDFTGDVRNAYISYVNAQSNINDFFSFFDAVGQFFNVIWSVICVPFKFLGWLLGLIHFSFEAVRNEDSALAALPLSSPFGVQGGAQCLWCL